MLTPRAPTNRPPWLRRRLLAPIIATTSALLLLLAALLLLSPATVVAWSPSSSSSSPRTHHPLATRPSYATASSSSSATAANSRPLFSTTSTSDTDAVDGRYYSPNSGGGLRPEDDPLAPTATSSELEAEAEAAARGNNYGNYGTGAAGRTGIGGAPGATKITLTRWLSAKVQDYPELRDMESLHLSIQMACKTISNLIHSSTAGSATAAGAGGMYAGGMDNSRGSMRDNSMKRLDQISKNVLQNALRFTGRLRVVEAPRNTGDDAEGEGPDSHQPGVTIAYALDQYGRGPMGGGSGGGARPAKWGTARRLAACFDPLDGSGNADAAICTGTVFGVFDADAGFRGGESPDLRSASSLSRAVLQPGNKLLAAGYCLYSSTTMLVFTLGGGTHGFTLDRTTDEFVLTHPNMRIPRRGNIYSCNEAYSEGWDPKFKGYLRALKTGRGETKQRYTQRYIGSMVGDIHRTLMYGGIFCCPADSDVHRKGNLQLAYKAAPMAYVLEKAGGRATDGNVDLLSVRPSHVHERSPCFMGSPEDMDELMGYLGGDDDGSKGKGGNGGGGGIGPR